MYAVTLRIILLHHLGNIIFLIAPDIEFQIYLFPAAGICRRALLGAVSGIPGRFGSSGPRCAAAASCQKAAGHHRRYSHRQYTFAFHTFSSLITIYLS